MARLSYMQRRPSGTYEFRKRLPTRSDCSGCPPTFAPPTANWSIRGPVALRANWCGRSARLTPERRSGATYGKRGRPLILFEAATVAMAEGPTVNGAGTRPPILADDLPLETIEAETVAELLARDEDERREGDDRRRLQTREERAPWPDVVPVPEPWAKGMSEEHAFVDGATIEEDAASYRKALSRHAPGIVRAENLDAHRRHQVPIDPTTLAYHAVGLAVLRGHVRAYDAMLRRQAGDVVDTPATPAPKGRGPKPSEAFSQWQAGSAASGARRAVA